MLCRIIKEKRRSALRSVRCRKCKLGFDNRTLLSLHKCSDDNGVDDSMKTSDLEEATNCPDCHKRGYSYQLEFTGKIHSYQSAFTIDVQIFCSVKYLNDD